MRGIWPALAISMLVTTTVVAQPPCHGTALLRVFADNRSGEPVDVHVDGELLDAAGTCTDQGLTAYPDTVLSCGPGIGSCGTIAGLRPGAWIHRIAVTVPGSDPQAQAQPSVLVAGDPVEASNALVWTVYPRTFVVSTAAADDGVGSLRAALGAASDYTAANPGPALVTFSRETFPSAVSPVTIDLAGSACEPDGPKAAVCFRGSNIVVDGLDRRAASGAVAWRVSTDGASLLRLYGHDNVFRGLVFEGSRTEVATPEIQCGSEFPQADTVAITGPDAQRNVVERSTVVGPTCGDGVGIDDGATATVVRDSRLTKAQDRGLKANGASVTISRSCVHDNAKGGIQSTLGGDVFAGDNVVQHNLGGVGGNGLTAIDKCRDDNPGCSHSWRTILETRGNVVRFSGGRGISVRDNASGTFASDYVANNLTKGSEVETTFTVPVDGAGHERVPYARLHGVALVCNYSDGVAGVGAETRLEIGHDPPDVSYGDAEASGRNAFTSNRGTTAGVNFLLTSVTTAIPAEGNQWGSCSGAVCDEAKVRANDIDPTAPDNANVALVESATTFDGPLAGAPMIAKVTPPRPQAGDVVRIYGEGFDAINGNPTRDVCPSVGLPSCSVSEPCSTGPCVAGVCPCSIDNPEVRARNEATANAPNPPNRILISSVATGSMMADLAPDAVTPTMLAFRMPFDCFAPMMLTVEKHGVADTRLICDPRGCGEQGDGAPCDDGDAGTTGDHCDGAGACVGDPLPPTTSTTTTTITSTTAASASTSTSTQPQSTSPTSSTTIGATTTSVTAPPTTTTLLHVCGHAVPSLQDVEACAVPRLRRRALRLLEQIEGAAAAGRQPRCRMVRRLGTLLARCDRLQ